ncbi:GGDEF domain-containing protein [Methylobrevis pamukkalensis]|uniref:Cyclic di-GMP phosphodiesterase Gmr n=1 Tax=Methylobrevis pamukkalensis TaxID=1439726 RepID=A0A1E3H448_9HYPH|nr:GGDEF domain-containing protein [Methylobrevis pamukkalensis]ODN71099.1 Cyclic di-GMP phosphodiesterase Gmr [Methylobrevis pamukkalensis]
MTSLFGHLMPGFDPALLLVGGLLCLIGTVTAARLFSLSTTRSGSQRLLWHVLAGLTLGTALWSARLVGMLAAGASGAGGFAAEAALHALPMAITGSSLGFILAASRRLHSAPLLGGLLLGLTATATWLLGPGEPIAAGHDGPVPVTLLALFVPLVMAIAAMLLVRGRPLAGTLALCLAVVCLEAGAVVMTADLANAGQSAAGRAAAANLALTVAMAASLVIGSGLASLVIDARSRAEIQREFGRLALTDPLTGLPNRGALQDRLRRDLADADRVGDKVAVLHVDIDHFREINDVGGHVAGDAVLKALGARAAAAIGDGEFVARLGGDEFVAIRRFRDRGELEDFNGRIFEAFHAVVETGGTRIETAASLGLALHPDDAVEAPELLANADLAAGRARADGAGRLCRYEAHMDEAIRGRRKLASDLRRALDGNQLALRYQVQTAVSSSASAATKCCCAGSIPSAASFRRRSSSPWRRPRA